MSVGTTPKSGRGGTVAALDVGSAKICCFIARPEIGGRLRIVGIGHHAARGVRSGTIVDMDAAETAIRATVEAAEQMAGENIRHVVVNISGGSPESRLIAYEMSIAGHEIGEADIRRLMTERDISASLIPPTPGCSIRSSRYAKNTRTNTSSWSTCPRP